MGNWIFLRGLTRESRHWGDFVALFQHTLQAGQVMALDLPGNGRLNQQRSPLQVHDMVEYCRAELAARHLAPPYQVLAMSLGAMVALAWADAYPQEINANVLISTSMRPFSAFYQRLRPANYAVLLKLIVTHAAPVLWERTILRLTANQTSEAVLPLWLALHRERPVSRVNALRQLIAATRFRASRPRPLTPTLLLASVQDHLVSVECSVTLARAWHCPLGLHPSAGHDIPLDDGPWVADQVRQWQMDGFK
jgi:pimeloyl-ACP methyl ester carboxylesterase